MVDKRTLEKYEREAKEKNRETWYLSWALDTNVEVWDAKSQCQLHTPNKMLLYIHVDKYFIVPSSFLFRYIK